MRCVCMECKKLYNIKEPFENDDETHGLCDECLSIYLKSLRESYLKSLREERKRRV